MMAQSSPSIWTSSTALRSDRSNILKLPFRICARSNGAWDTFGVYRLGGAYLDWDRARGAQFHLFHSAAPNFKREPKPAAVADKPKARRENLTRSSTYPTSPNVNAARTRQRICDANAMRIDSGQCLERNACTTSPLELFPETRSAIP